jgi:hypothetical protein
LGADGTVIGYKKEVDSATADSGGNRSGSIDNACTPPIDQNRRPTVLPDVNDMDSLNEIYVPGSSKSAEEW